MMAETDFQQEARHISEFENYLEKSGMSKVATCPFVYKQLTTKRYASILAPCFHITVNQHMMQHTYDYIINFILHYNFAYDTSVNSCITGF